MLKCLKWVQMSVEEKGMKVWCDLSNLFFSMSYNAQCSVETRKWTFLFKHQFYLMHACNFMLHFRISLSLSYLFPTTLTSLRCWEVSGVVNRTQGDEVVVRHWRTAADDCTEVIGCRHPWKRRTGNKPINIYYKDKHAEFHYSHYIQLFSAWGLVTPCDLGQQQG